MSKEQVSQELFIKVKERLDYHRLPVTFPIEATPLLSKLLAMLDNKSGPRQSPPGLSSQGECVSAALKYEMARLVKENNQLHMNLIVEKEQVQSLEHGLFKATANQHSDGKELEKYSGMKMKREQELIEELREVRYKYNELMDFLHEDPRADREYIKRLMKHKQVSVEEMRVEGPREAGFRGGDMDFRVKELQAKVSNRQKQIMRLQKLIEYDGVNMNKLIKNFEEGRTKKQLKNADSKINYLEDSYTKIKKENSSMRNKNGLKEALRAEVDNCHQIIDTLKKDNQLLRRNHQEQNFDVQKKAAENNRNIGKARSEKTQADRVTLHSQELIKDLQKRIGFLEREAEVAKEALQESEEAVAVRERENGSLAKRNEEGKVFYEYQLENLRKRVVELQFQNEEHMAKAKELLNELQVTIQENQIKTESIINLEKIVNELIRKNSLLADHTAGTLEESLKQSAELELKNRLAELDRHAGQLKEENIQLESNLRTLEHRFGQVVNESERFKFDNGVLRNELTAKETSVAQLAHELDQLKFALKREQTDYARAAGQNEELCRHKDCTIAELRGQNERLVHQEKALKLRVKDLQIKMSEQEGVWEVTRERLDEKEAKIKQLEKMLGESVEQLKGLSNQVSQLDHKNHELTRDNHRLSKMYEEVKKDGNEFKATSFKSYETAIGESVREVAELKKEMGRLLGSNEGLSVRCEEMEGLLRVGARERELGQFDKISWEREVEILKTRLMEMQEIERALVLQNESLRSGGRVQD